MHSIKVFFTQCSLFWKFLGFFQPTLVRFWHIFAVLLVLTQTLKIIDTHLLSVWHIELGLFLMPFVCIFMYLSFSRRGLKYFFPYLWGETALLRTDLQKLFQGAAVAPRKGGLPGAVQGLGFICFFMTTLCGLLWYVFWEHDPKFSVNFLDLHRYFAYALIVYILGHGFMAGRQFMIWRKNQAAQAKKK